jgi:hypothetical protein
MRQSHISTGLSPLMPRSNFILYIRHAASLPPRPSAATAVTAHARGAQRRLYQEQQGRCFWCSAETQFITEEGPKRGANFFTVDHVLAASFVRGRPC